MLDRIDDEGAYANLVLSGALDRSGLRDADRRFVTDLVYGTTRRRRACDYLVDRFLARPVDGRVRNALRLGAYQLAFAGVARTRRWARRSGWRRGRPVAWSTPCSAGSPTRRCRGPTTPRA